MNAALLASVAAAGAAGGRFAPDDDLKTLHENGLVVVNIDGGPDGAGLYHATVTDAGRAQIPAPATAPNPFAAQSQTITQNDVGSVASVLGNAPGHGIGNQSAPKAAFNVVTGFVPPPRAPRKVGTSANIGVETYPFSKLEKGQATFVPATAKMPEPEVSLLSAVSAANRRFATVTSSKVIPVTRKGVTKDQERKTYAYGKYFEVFPGMGVNVGTDAEGKINYQPAQPGQAGEKGAWIVRTDSKVGSAAE